MPLWEDWPRFWERYWIFLLGDCHSFPEFFCKHPTENHWPGQSAETRGRLLVVHPTDFPGGFVSGHVFPPKMTRKIRQRKNVHRLKHKHSLKILFCPKRALKDYYPHKDQAFAISTFEAVFHRLLSRCQTTLAGTTEERFKQSVG